MSLTTGQVLQSRYRIAALLGEGGTGAVYKAEDLRLRVSVALKEMAPKPGLDPETLQQLRDQFKQEAMTLVRLKHPHFVGVSDYFAEADRVAGALLGIAIGDALGNTTEGQLPKTRRAVYGEIRDYLPNKHADLQGGGVQEQPRKTGTVLTDVVPVQPKWEDGYLLPPATPGLGVVFDREVAKAHSMQMAELPHLRTLDGSVTNW